MDIVRPSEFSGFSGQRAATENLQVFMDAALSRGEVLDHVLIHGPPGLGKTTLSGIIASSMGSLMHRTSAPILQKPLDVVRCLMGVEAGGILFIDEIHRLPITAEECLYGAMEDGSIDILVGEGPSQRPVKVDIPPFTLIGATTRIGGLSKPLVDRFGILLRLEYYDVEELSSIILSMAASAGVVISSDAARALASRSRGTPRIAGRLLRRLLDFSLHMGRDAIDVDVVAFGLGSLGIDSLGLEEDLVSYLQVLASARGGLPVGLSSIAVAISEPIDTVEDVIEPYLLRLGLIARTGRGRVLTERGYLHIGIEPPDAMRAA